MPHPRHPVWVPLRQSPLAPCTHVESAPSGAPSFEPDRQHFVQRPPNAFTAFASSSTRSAARRSPPQRSQDNTLILSWNSGGPQSTGLEQLMLWTETLPIQMRPHIILVQETHWSLHSEWIAGGWHCISSKRAPQDKYAALLTMVRILGVHRMHRVLPGRLDHIRVEYGGTAVDILHLYQKAVSFSQSQETYQKRMHIWRLLCKLLRIFPERNYLLLAGDFNTQLPESRPCVGPRIPAGSGDGQISKDVSTLQEMMATFKLTALNTLSARRPYTYRHVDRCTQIDFTMMRQDQAGGPAKSSRPVHDETLQGWRDTKHFPIEAEFLVSCNGPPSRGRHECRRFDLRGMKKSLAQGDIPTEFRTSVQLQVQQLQRHNYSGLNDTLLQLCRTHYSMQKPAQQPAWQAQGIRNRVSMMWSWYKQYRGLQVLKCQPLLQMFPSCFCIRGIFSRWRALLRFQQARKHSREYGRQCKKAKLVYYLSRADEAFNRHDQHSLYQVIRAL